MGWWWGVRRSWWWGVRRTRGESGGGGVKVVCWYLQHASFEAKFQFAVNTVLTIPNRSPFPSQMKCSLCCSFRGLAEHQSFPVEFGAVLLGGQVVRDFMSVAVAAKDDSKSPYVCLAVNIPRRSLLGAPAIHLNVDALWRNGRGQESGG